MAVTDHHRYAPSLEAITVFAAIPHDLRIYPGEELHPNGVHIVNFGGRFGVDELLNTEETAREVAEIRHAQPPVPPGVDPAWAAQTQWAFDKVREAGGLAIFCHPYWVFGEHYSLAEAYIEYIFATQPFDAFELIGGFMRHETESNLLQVARYHEERARGRTFPIGRQRFARLRTRRPLRLVLHGRVLPHTRAARVARKHQGGLCGGGRCAPRRGRTSARSLSGW